MGGEEGEGGERIAKKEGKWQGNGGRKEERIEWREQRQSS